MVLPVTMRRRRCEALLRVRVLARVDTLAQLQLRDTIKERADSSERGASLDRRLSQLGLTPASEEAVTRVKRLGNSTAHCADTIPACGCAGMDPGVEMPRRALKHSRHELKRVGTVKLAQRHRCRSAYRRRGRCCVQQRCGRLHCAHDYAD